MKHTKLNTVDHGLKSFHSNYIVHSTVSLLYYSLHIRYITYPFYLLENKVSTFFSFMSLVKVAFFKFLFQKVLTFLSDESPKTRKISQISTSNDSGYNEKQGSGSLNDVNEIVVKSYASLNGN